MKKRITIRLDEDILEYYKSLSKKYQSLINTTLRECMNRTEKSTEKYRKNSSLLEQGGYRKVASPDFFKPMPKTAKGKKP